MSGHIANVVRSAIITIGLTQSANSSLPVDKEGARSYLYKELRDLGASVSVHPESNGGGFAVSLRQPCPLEKAIPLVTQLGKVSELGIRGYSLGVRECRLIDEASSHVARIVVAECDVGTAHLRVHEYKHLSACTFVKNRGMHHGQLKSIADCKALTILGIEDCTELSGTFTELKSCGTLEWLRLSRLGLVDSDLIRLGKCGRLGSLGLQDNPRIGDDSCDFQWAPRLVSLNVRGTAVSRKGVDRAMKTSPVRVLYVDGCNFPQNEADALQAQFPFRRVAWIGKH